MRRQSAGDEQRKCCKVVARNGFWQKQKLSVNVIEFVLCHDVLLLLIPRVCNVPGLFQELDHQRVFS